MAAGGALLAGNANNGANAGFGYLNTNNRSSNSNANYGFRLYRCNERKIIYVCHNLTSQGLSALPVAGRIIDEEKQCE